MLLVVTVRDERICGASPDAMHVDAVEDNPLRRAAPSAAKQVYSVARLNDSAENLAKMNLGAAGLRIFVILPVEDQDLHQIIPERRAYASRTPLTKRALSSLPNRSASFTASLITTRGGVSRANSSAAPRRSTDLSIAPTRSRRQLVVTSE